MCGDEVVKVIVNEWGLINATQDRGGENRCYDQPRDRQYFAKERLLPNGNSLRQVPSSLGLVVLPGMHVFLKPCLGLVSFRESMKGFFRVISHRKRLLDSSQRRRGCQFRRGISTEMLCII